MSDTAQVFEDEQSTDLESVLGMIRNALLAGGGVRIVDPWGNLVMAIPGAAETVESIAASVTAPAPAAEPACKGFAFNGYL